MFINIEKTMLINYRDDMQPFFREFIDNQTEE